LLCPLLVETRQSAQYQGFELVVTDHPNFSFLLLQAFVANERAVVRFGVLQVDVSAAFAEDNPYESILLRESNLYLSPCFSLKTPQ
jgi:hypothetical protein